MTTLPDSSRLPVTDRADVKMNEVTIPADAAHPEASCLPFQIGQGYPGQSHISGYAPCLEAVSCHMPVPQGQQAIVSGRTVPRVHKKRLFFGPQTFAGSTEQEKKTGVDPYSK